VTDRRALSWPGEQQYDAVSDARTVLTGDARTLQFVEHLIAVF